MKNLTVRPEFSPHYGDRHYLPEPPKDVVRFAGESFTAMKAMQDEYGRSIPATYAEKTQSTNSKTPCELSATRSGNFR